MALADLLDKRAATARDELPHGGAQDLVARAQLALDNEIGRLAFDLRVELLCKVEDVLDNVDLSFNLLIQVGQQVTTNIPGQSQPTCIC